MSTPINIVLDGQTLLDEMAHCKIDFDSKAYCYTVEVGLKSLIFWGLCDPNISSGSLRLVIYIGSAIYEFLVEERDTSVRVEGVSFTVWGRSKQALLAAPYSKIIIDRDEDDEGGPATDHPWQDQLEGASVSTFFDTILSYCPYDVSFQWNVLDYIVMEGSFSVNGQTPIGIIESLANVIGAQLVAHIDGSLTVEYFSIEEGAFVHSYTDLDDIVALDEIAIHPSGFDSVVVYGYDSSIMDCYISTERLDDDSDPDTPLPNILPGVDHTVRVYAYHASDEAVLFDFDDGTCNFIGSGVENITEDVQIIFGSGNTTKPNLSGETEVEGDESDPFEIKEVAYNVAYRDYAVRADVVGDYAMMFYFEDEACYTIYSFTVNEDDVEDCCSAIRIELYDSDRDTDYYPDGWADPIGESVAMGTGSKYHFVSDYRPARPIFSFLLANEGRDGDDTSIYPGDVVKFRVFRGDFLVRAAYASCNQTPTLVQAGITEYVSEQLTFTKGEATASYIINAGSLLIEGCDIASAFTYRCNKITVPAYEDSEPEYYNLGNVTYTAAYDEWSVTIPGSGRTRGNILGGGNILAFPGSFDFENFIIWFYFDGCEDPVSLVLTISDPEVDGVDDGVIPTPPAPKDVTLIIKDWATEARVPNAYVVVDGIKTGYTDLLGTITFFALDVGTHTLKITKTGYVDSDKDEISNDTFEVKE